MKVPLPKRLRKAVLAASLFALPLSPLWAQKIYFDMAHGEAPWPPQMLALGKRVGYQIEAGNGPRPMPPVLPEARSRPKQRQRQHASRSPDDRP